MTTITLNKSSINFSKTNFNDVYELTEYILENIKDYGLKKLDKSLINDSLIEKAEKCRKKSSDCFINL